MLEDYKKVVTTCYHLKKVKGQLSSNLSHPTPAKLREECLLVLSARPLGKDEKIIKDFFNLGEISIDYSHSIRKFDADRLRPLVNFLKDKIENPEPRNIELLAWLIDFEPRPYKFGTDYNTSPIFEEREKIDVSIEEDDVNTDQSKNPEQSVKLQIKKSNSKSILKKAIPTATLLFLITGGICSYIYWQSTKVYICNSRVAKKYHLNHNCPSLDNCKSEVISITLADAKKDGRSLCGFED
ncbi:hypothetical protein LPB86_02935 [Pedobacter sp. MC2016-14]|uniref:hypothetical protein n=1 Tax=Pedobacter sp. MC2016-14 TaxID=2897327 RepID=UPI001E408C2A|nr:hypothetical protein [Pedobacter sp. MC2016-14]MCD0487166.1 hypothetical protein [Pedobacter sp. MC2016-14]